MPQGVARRWMRVCRMPKWARQIIDEGRLHRRKIGMSFEVAGERTGLGKQYIDRLENGHVRNPTVGTIERYLKGIGLAMCINDKFTFVEITELPTTKDGRKSYSPTRKLKSPETKL